MKTLVSAIGVLIFTEIVFPQPDTQYTIDRIELLPNLPQPFEIRDWTQVAIDYDDIVFDFNRVGTYLPLINWDSVFTLNGQPTFSLPSYVGGANTGGEAINTMAAIVSASLVGMDKSNQNGHNWVEMCRKYFANYTAGIYLNNPGGGWGGSFWYDILPNILFYQLFDLYPEITAFPNEFISVANQWHAAGIYMGGSETTIPNFNYTYFDFQSMTPVDNGTWREPDAAAGIAWLEYLAWVKTGDSRFLTTADWGMQFLDNSVDNPYYEILLVYGAYIAARMNAELNRNYDVHKLINWCFGPSYARPGWGIVTGNWNGYDCGGLAGSITDSDGYAFAMNTFESAGALVPLVRYDNHYARAVGKWMLNLVNAARYFYANGLPVENQDGEAWALSYDSTFCISFEGLRHDWNGMSPVATGDAVRMGWAPTNFALYGSSHVGLLGALVDTTNIDAILKLDLLKTDYFRAAAYPTYLFYNPYDSEQTIDIDVGNELQDLYDAVTNTFLIQGVSDLTSFTVPPDSAVVLVVTPANGTISYDGYKLLVNNVVVDYHFSDTADTSNQAPVISSLTADPSEVHLGTPSSLVCEAYDPDGDNISFIWSAVGGSIEGTGSTATWTAPLQLGDYYITCTVRDSYGKDTRNSLVITVIDTTHSSSIDLVAYYPFNGNANDASDYGHDGGVYGATLTSDRFGNENSAYYFDGIFDRIQVPNSSALNFQDSITVNYWIKPGEIPAPGSETYPVSHGSWEERWKFTFMGNRKIKWTVNAADGIGDLDSNTELDTSHFYFISGLYDGSNLNLYINGAFDTSRPLTGSINQTGLDLTIGQSKPGVTDYNFKGIIDDIRIYGRILSEAEIQDLYHESLNILSDGNLARRYSLAPNYPNPFNPSTTIQYEIPIRTHVTMTVYNIIGQIVDVLVDEDKESGIYLVTWNAAQLSSGVYFYQFQSSDYTMMRKCIVIK